MNKILLILLALIMAAGTFHAGADRPDSPGRSGNSPPQSTDCDCAPEIIILPTDQTDITPAGDNAPAGVIIGEGPVQEISIDWFPCV